MRVRLRRVRLVLADRAAFVTSVTGLSPLAPRSVAIKSVALHLERAQHGIQDLLAATQKVSGGLLAATAAC